MYRGVEIIAEVKTESPFGYTSKNTWDELFKIADTIGDTISIHTDPHWGGSFDLIKKAKSLTDKPILAKGIHSDDSQIDQAIQAGADWVLVVGRLPQIYQDQYLIEPNSLAELKNIPSNYRIVWNSRDLKTGGNKKEIFSEARNIHPGWLCQASNVCKLSDINPKANAVLIGTHLIDIYQELPKDSLA